MLAEIATGLFRWYTRMGGGFTFASEIKSLLHVTGVQRKVNRRAVDDFLSMRYAPGPETFFEDFSTRTGLYASDRPGRWRSESALVRSPFPEQYTNPFSNPKEAAEELDRLLEASVNKRFRRRFQRTLFIGWIDSSVLAHYGKSHAQGSSILLFPRVRWENRRNSCSSRSRQIPRFISHGGSSGDELMKELPRVVSAIEAPVANSDILGLWALKTAQEREGCPVWRGSRRTIW